MKIVKINANEILNWDAFHECFARTLGFPDFYGRNMMAWIDCMTSLDSPSCGMTDIHVEIGQILVIDIVDVDVLVSTNNEIYEELVTCAAFVNHRRIDKGQSAVLTLSFHKST